jgi:hypothetical protein
MTSLRTELAVGFTQRDTPTLLRRGVLALAWLGLVGTTTELIFLRHWASATQLIVWPFIAVLGVAAVLVSARPTARSILIVRWLAVAVVVASVVGVGLHIVENLDSGPLDRDYASIWVSMSVFDQWWAAITGGVGPAPVLAPGALAEVSLALALATLRHPVLVDGHASPPVEKFGAEEGRRSARSDPLGRSSQSTDDVHGANHDRISGHAEESQHEGHKHRRKGIDAPETAPIVAPRARKPRTSVSSPRQVRETRAATNPIARPPQTSTAA